MKKIAFLFTMFLAVCFVLVSCGDMSGTPSTKTYKITFDTDGGSNVAAIIAEAGAEIAAPTIPTKDGYNFVGWFLGDVEYTFSIMPETNITLKAKWEEIIVPVVEYTITLDVNGGNALAETTITGETGTPIELPTPTREGYNFLGWYNGEAKFEETVMLEANISLVAKWEEIVVPVVEYTITLDVNGGNALAETTITGEAGTPIELPTLTREGYNFLGWFNGETKFEETVMPEANLTLVAKWEEIVVPVVEYTITLDVNGGNALAETSITSEAGTELSLPTPTREGYNFIGWLFEGAPFNETLMPEANLTLVAGWEIIAGEKIEITYILNGGYVSYNNFEEVVADFAKDFNAHTGKSILTDGSNFFSSTWMADGSSLGFNFLISEEYGVKWNWMLEVINASRVERGLQALALTDGQAEARGEIHNFLNLCAPGEKGGNVSFGSDYSSYEAFAKIEAAIDGKGYKTQAETGSSLLVDVNRCGYSFEGWYSDEALTNKVTKVEGTSTLYAKWEKIYKTLTYVLNNNDASIPNTEVNIHVSDKFELINPTFNADNYVFNGWFLDEALTEKINEIAQFTAEDVTVYASWTALTGNQYKIVYTLNEGNWFYANREEMVEDFLDDAVEWGGKNSRPNGMVQGEGETTIGFANLFTSFEAFFKHEVYGAKWAWLKEYVIATSPDASQFTGSSKEAYYRYSIGAFIFKEYRSAWPKSGDYTSSTLADGFWPTLNKVQETTFIYDGEQTLPTPYRLYYKFIGWYDNLEFTGEPMTKATKSTNLYAKWEEEVAVTSITITNLISELARFDTHELVWELNPSNAANKEVKFATSDETVAIVDENGVITALACGTVTITITSLSSTGASTSLSFNVFEPDHFEVSYETVSYVTVENEIKLLAEYEKKDNSSAAIVWSSLNNDIATVNSGVVKGVKAGQATIRASVTDEIYFDFVVTVLDENLSNAIQYVINSHESNVFTRYNLGIGAGTPVYYADILGSVNKFLYNYDYKYNTSYLQKCMDNGQWSSGLSNVEFIVVHYTAGMSKGSNAEATAKFFSGNSGASAHFCTGNDGVFQTLDLDVKGWHAGDGANVSFAWSNTGVKVDANDPKWPVWGISSNAKFTINGKETTITVPEKTQRGNEGYVTDSKWITEQGLAFKIVDGYYHMGSTWWCYSNVWEGRICSKGGNKHGIGIESAVDEGSDLWLTWQITARLCADLMVKYNLDITRVTGHNLFAAKDCPQPLLENDLEIWWEFIELVEAEYEAMTTYKDYKFNFNVVKGSELINSNGRVTEQPEYSTTVTYEVEVNGEKVQLSSIIPGIYTK